MRKSVHICKICGVEYPYCRTNREDNAFRWQDVACCPEHGAEYLDRIMKSREAEANQTSVDNHEVQVVVEANEAVVDEPAPKKTRKKRVKAEE